MLKVSTGYCFQRQRMVRVVTLKLIGHVGKEHHHVLLTYLTVCPYIQFPWIAVVKGSSLHIQLGIEIRIGCVQMHLHPQLWVAEIQRVNVKV